MVGSAPALTAIDLSVPTRIEAISDPAPLHLAKDAWADFALRANLNSSPHPVLTLPTFTGLPEQGSLLAITVYQVLPVAVNLDTADSVRQTGEDGGVRQVPRVLLPLPVNNGSVDLSAMRDPEHPTDLSRHAVDQPVLILVELHSTSTITPGLHIGHFDLLDAPDGDRTAMLPIQLAVDDIDLSNEPRLTIAAPLDWTELAALYPTVFEAVTPRLLSRSDPQHAQLIDLLGHFVSLAHENHVSAYIPRLQPIVKWPVGQTAEADWADFDSIVAPWLWGDGFADHRPIGFWPLPEPDSLSGFDPTSRNQYWRLAVEHFAQKRWLSHSMAMLHNDSPGPATDAESMMLSVEARQILLADPRLRALLPLRDDQIQLSSDANTDAVPPLSASRLLALSPGMVYPSPIRVWPTDVPPPQHWIDADPRDDSASYFGTCTEQDIRTLAALAALREASVIHCGSPLPRPGVPADANQLIWFYPGQAYGVDHPLATLQLKWLRQAVQDYSYFHLARHDVDVAKMYRLITRPVKLLPGQQPEPVTSALDGATDPQASEHAIRLITDAVKQYPPSKLPDTPYTTDPVNLRTIQWFHEHQKPTLVPTAVRWMWPDAIDQSTDEPGRWIDAAVTVALYNPAEEMPNGNELQWATVPPGWQIHPQPRAVPALAQFQVHHVVTHARFNLDRITTASREPLELNFIDGFDGRSVPCQLVLPVAVSERRRHHLVIDGSLDDWDAADALQLDQPLIAMLDRPALRSQAIRQADTKTSIYSAWSDENLYLAFRLGGVTGAVGSGHNFVQYDSGRAWGEDLCELLIQPVYADNAVGPTLHIVCKPGGGEWIERKSGGPSGPDAKWEPFEAAGVRYAYGVDPAKKIWRGELAIPWQAIAAVNRYRPGLLRFNFIQHQQSTSQSASWAGPIDQSRDDSLSGLLLLREPENGVGNTARRE